MRSIKFRAWDKIHKEMSTWSSLYDNPNLWEYILSHNEQFENWIGDIVLMQYTGLKDKNGKEIYEKDVLKLGFSGISGKGYVYWCKNTGQWWIKDIRENVKERNKGRTYSLYQPAMYEIIGNVYQDKHLLEGEQ